MALSKRIFPVLLALLLTGCLQQPPMDSPANTATPLSTHQTQQNTPLVFTSPTATGKVAATATLPSLPTLTVTATATALSTEFHQAYSGKILFNLGKISDCIPQKRAGIWLADEQSKTMTSLLQSPDTDYLDPTWSPDGQWIAYVASRPIQITDPAKWPEKTAADSIWVMRPDKTMQKKISDDIPSFIIHFGLNNSCTPESKITYPLIWSPDGKHIIFTQSTYDLTLRRFVYIYYVANMETGKSQVLFSDQHPGPSSAIWVNNNVIAITSAGAIELLKDFDLGKPTITEIGYPADIPAGSEAFFSTSRGNNDNENLVVSFRIGSTEISPVPKEIAVWKLNTTLAKWEYLTTIKKQTWSLPEIINGSVLLCEENQITIFDATSWNVVDTIPSDQLQTELIDCGLLEIPAQQPIGNNLLIFNLTSQNNKVEVKKITIPFQSTNELDISSVFFQLKEQTQVLDFSVAPNN